MKKLKRDIEKFDVLDLFANIGAQYGYDYRDPTTTEDFINRVRQSIEDSKTTDTVIHGQRTEALFAYVIGALGKAVLVHQEDSGDIFFRGDDVQLPDYRLTFNNGKQLLIEVKNCHNLKPTAKFTIHKAYYRKLARYAELNSVELKFAVLFSRWNRWCLLSINSFEEHQNHYQINMLNAIQMNEMATLGDLTIGTAPELEIEVLADPSEASEIDKNGQAKFVIREIKLYCQGNEILNPFEKRLAHFLIRFGDWGEQRSHRCLKDNRLLGMRLVFSPESQEDPNFALIGTLSSMVTTAYKNETAENGEVTGLKVGFDPAAFEVVIPTDYKGEQLPLWRFKLQPKNTVD